MTTHKRTWQMAVVPISVFGHQEGGSQARRRQSGVDYKRPDSPLAGSRYVLSDAVREVVIHELEFTMFRVGLEIGAHGR